MVIRVLASSALCVHFNALHVHKCANNNWLWSLYNTATTWYVSIVYFSVFFSSLLALFLFNWPSVFFIYSYISGFWKCLKWIWLQNNDLTPTWLMCPPRSSQLSALGWLFEPSGRSGCLSNADILVVVMVSIDFGWNS